MTNFSNIANQYFDYVKVNTYFNVLTDIHTEVLTPYLDPYDDFISFDIFYDNGNYIITDDGYTIWTLNKQNITELNENDYKRLSSLIETNDFVLDDKKVITKTVNKQDVAQTMHEITQLLLTIFAQFSTF